MRRFFLDTYITTPDQDFCLEPETSGCDISDNTSLVYKTSDKHCNKEYSVFNHNMTSGKLIHKCSNKEVCGQFRLGDGSPLIMNATCYDPEQNGRFLRTLCE